MLNEQEANVILGIDFGTKKIGLATGQKLTQTATPLTTIFSTNGLPNWTQLALVFREWRPEACVIGCALHDDRTESATALRAKAFGDEISQRFSVPVYYIDEHLTSHEARLLSKEEPLYRNISIDAIAAKLILEAWLVENSS